MAHGILTGDWNALAGALLCGLAALYAVAAACAVLAAVRRASLAMLSSVRQASVAAATQEPVSVLKPLCGNEPRLYENLRSFCEQGHPCYQLVFGVRDALDPAIAVVRRLQTEFPALDIEMVIDPRGHGDNLKIANLLNMLPHAKYDRLVLADSDIAVPPDYLVQVVAPLADPSVGTVTCPYRGRALGGLWSRLGVLFIDDWFAPSVQVAHQLGSPGFGFGSTLALRRDTLARIGGFETLRDTLADDFWLAELARRAGLRTLLSEVTVVTDVTERSLAALWDRELRWMRTSRSIEPLGFAFVFVTFTMPLLLLGLALGHNLLCLGLAGIGLTARLVLHYLQRRTRRELSFGGELLLLVLPRETLLMAQWFAAMTGWRVRWRNQTLHAAREHSTPSQT
jgi:ceramide glucosyltransferase